MTGAGEGSTGHGEVVIRIVGVGGGGRTAFDGQWLVEYDPTRPGVDPDGRAMVAHVVCTDDPDRARRFPDAGAAHREWTRSSGRTRPDGREDRPLTAFHVALLPAPPRRDPAEQPAPD